MPLQINPADYGFASIADLAKIAGTLQGEAKVGGNIYDRAAVADVLANRAASSAFKAYGNVSADGRTYSGAVSQGADPRQFNVWYPTINGKPNGAYQSATEMQGIITRLGSDPNYWDRLTPLQQQNVSLNLTASRGVFGQYDPNQGNTANASDTYSPQGGSLRGLTGGATYYSNPRYNAASQMPVHIRLGLNQGVNQGDNVFYAGSPAATAAMAQRMRAFDRGQALTDLTVGDDTEGDANALGAGMLARMATKYGNLPEASEVNRFDPFTYGGINLDPARYALNPAPAYDPGLSALDRFSDTITQGLQGAFGSIANAYNSDFGRIITPEEMKTRLDEISNGGASLGQQLQDIHGSAEASAFNASGRTPTYASLPTFGSYSDPYASVGDFLGIMNGPGGLSNGSFADPSVAGSSAFTPANLTTAAYHQWLGRDPTAEERGAWADAIGQSGSNLSTILAGIAGSQEANNLRGTWGTDASTGGAGSYDGFLGHTSYGSDASTAGSVPAYMPNSGLAYGTDASRGGAYSYDPILGVTALGSDASTGGAASYGTFLDPYGFSQAGIGTAGGIGNATPDPLGFNGGAIANGFDPTLPNMPSLTPVNTAGLGMTGATDAANSGAYGSSSSSVPTPALASLGSFDPITAGPVNTSLPNLPNLTVPTQVGPYSFATNAQGLVDVSTLSDPMQQAIARAYEQELGRAPDAAGLASWLTPVANGMSGSQLYGALSGSAEGQARAASGVTLPTFLADLNPYAFGAGLNVGTAGGIGNPTPDALGLNLGSIANGFNPSLPAFSPLPEVNTSGLGMNGATDSANSGAYGGAGSTATATPDTLAGFGPITPSVPFSGTLPDAAPLPLPTLSDPFSSSGFNGMLPAAQPLDAPAPGVGPMAFGHIDASSGLGGILNGLYAGALGRQADQSGLDAYGQAIRSGTQSLSGVYDILRNSTEGQGYTPPSALSFDPVWNLYGYALGRAPDSAGFQATADALQSGQSYYDVLSNMLTSQEGLQYAGSQGRDGNFVADQLAGLAQAKGAFDLGGISAGGQPVASGGFGGIPAAAWLSPYEVQARSAARSRLMANDAANVANNAYITNQNAFDTAATNNPSLAGVGGSVHGDATGAGATLNNISQQLANETRAQAAIPAAPTFTPVQTNFYGAQPTANSRNVFAGGLPPGAGFI